MPRSLHKSGCRHIKALFAVLLALSLLLSGCGDSSKPLDQTENSQPSSEQSGNMNNTQDGNIASSSLHYRATEKVIPDPKTIFENDPENQGKNMFSFMEDSVFADSVYADAKITLSLVNSFSAGERLCLLYSIMYIVDETGTDSTSASFTGSYCICVLDAPYEQWSFYTFSSSAMSSDPAFIPIVQRIVGMSHEGLYLSLGSDGIGFYGWDGSCRHAEEIDTDSGYGTLALYSAGGILYAITSNDFTNGSFSSYDEQLKPVVTRQNLEHKVSGCILSDSEYLWYGFDDDQNLTVWDKPNGTQLFSLGNMVNVNSDFIITKDADEFILADLSGIWTGKGDEPLQKVLSFSENGYTLQELFALHVNEDGSLSLVVRFENNLCLLTLEQTDAPDKQIITTICSVSSFDDVVAAFNRQSDKYQVVLINPYESGDIDAYRRQLQLDLSAGRGPDLIEPWLIDLEGGIRNGFLESLDDVVENPADYWPACLEGGKRDGVQYAIPYFVVLSFLVASESLTNGMEAWTLEQMMDAVQNSPAEALQKDFDSLDIALEYGLTPRDNPAFIDYEAGVSHLAEQPFIDFLKFAKNYGDDLYYTAETGYSETADYYLDGRLAVHSLIMYDPSDLLFASACFQEQEVLIGMPSARERGVYMSSNQLCLNSNSQCKEGAKEFLRYLISQEGQTKFVQYKNDFLSQHADYFFRPDNFSCRRDVTEASLKHYQENVKEGQRSEHLGVITRTVPLSDEQIEQFFSLFEDARPEWELPSEIYNIACEELEPYFAGDCSAEEAAGKLDNRVQLYFDERN